MESGSRAADFDLAGFVDMHIHAAPDVRPRVADDVTLARSAAEAGMRAILLKSHVTLTADRATIAERVVDGIAVRGGLVLNEPVGGLNPRAVEVALQLGAVQVWMPTMDAAYYRHKQREGGGVAVCGDDGRLLPAVHDVLDLLRGAGVALGTGHLAVAETVTLVRAAKEMGLRKVVITHPEAHFLQMPLEVQRDLVGEGVFFERCFLSVLRQDGDGVSFAELAAQIRAVGATSTVLATDLGQAGNTSPVEGMRAGLAALRAEGFSAAELRLMAAESPAYLMGL